MYITFGDPTSIVGSTDNVLFRGRGILADARLSAVSADSSAVFYDGVSTGGKKLFTLTALAKTGDSWAPVGGIPLEVGLYVDVTGNGAEVAVQVNGLDSSGQGDA